MHAPVASAAYRAEAISLAVRFDLDEYVFAALRAGASGFLLKDKLPGEVLAAVRVISPGDAPLSPRVIRRPRRVHRLNRPLRGIPTVTGASK